MVSSSVYIPDFRDIDFSFIHKPLPLIINSRFLLIVYTEITSMWLKDLFFSF